MKLYWTFNTRGFAAERARLTRDLIYSGARSRATWQQLQVEGSENHKTHELRDVTLHIEFTTGDRDLLQEGIKPDLPWAEDHFAERVGGKPINPGKAHAYWPYHGASIQEHLRGMGEKGEHYDHNYMERMWCKGLTHQDIEIESQAIMPDGEPSNDFFTFHPAFSGYRFSVGDLGDVVELLKKEPTTRQAYLPIWFPEDTGVTQGQRVPCTLGYYFQIDPLTELLHMTYNLRACELYRHFTNDVYLALRLQQWVADQVSDDLTEVGTGEFTMNIANMHLFKGDVPKVQELF